MKKIISLALCALMLSQTAVVMAEPEASTDDISALAEEKVELTPIEGTDYYITKNTFYVNITDAEGTKLIDMDFRDVETKLGEYDTIKVWYPVGMNDRSAGLLDKNLNIIVPNDSINGSVDFTKKDGKVYAAAHSAMTSDVVLYEIKTEEEAPEEPVVPDEAASSSALDTSVDITSIVIEEPYSNWAEKSIKTAIAKGLVPESLQSGYTNKITRDEFCRIAMQTYTAVTGKAYTDAVTGDYPFTDTKADYITAAYRLGVVSGIGKGLFAPENLITRQEAAVMLVNLAEVIEKNTDRPRTEKFADESYFAAWAKDEIYIIAGMKSGDTFVMAGTGEGKFSPWMNYTREQAIATMLRLAEA